MNNFLEVEVLPLLQPYSRGIIICEQLLPLLTIQKGKPVRHKGPFLTIGRAASASVYMTEKLVHDLAVPSPSLYLY